VGRPEVAIYAMGLVGTPYRYGGNTPQSGFDCSGLIAHVFTHAARLATPRTVAELGRWGRAVPAEQVQTGDLVLFGPGAVPTHAGIVVEGGRFVHAPSTGGTVRIDPWRARHWQVQLLGFRRG
jgi:cell wall-associated NlpC family hydrolase